MQRFTDANVSVEMLFTCRDQAPHSYGYTSRHLKGFHIPLTTSSKQGWQRTVSLEELTLTLTVESGTNNIQPLKTVQNSWIIDK